MDNNTSMKIKVELHNNCILTVAHMKCEYHGVLDALSRNPLTVPDEDKANKIKFGHIVAISELYWIKKFDLSKLEEEAIRRKIQSFA